MATPEEERERARLQEKMRKAAQLLFLRRHRNPGVREWELRKVVGSDFRAVLKALDEKLEELGLTVKEVADGEAPRFLVTVRGNPPPELEPSLGWMKVDALAALAACITFITSHGGRAPPSELEAFLSQKFSRKRARLFMDRFVQDGYLEVGRGGAYQIGWRTAAEVDLAELAKRITSSAPAKGTSSSETPSQPS